MFDYSARSWELLKYEFIDSEDSDLEHFCYEYKNKNGDPEASNYPFLESLKKEAEIGRWLELAADSNELKARNLEEQVSLQLKQKLGKLQHLNKTLAFAREACGVIEGAMPSISSAMSRHSQVADMEPLERAKYFEILIKVYTQLNKIEREYMGIKDTSAIIEEVYNAFGQGKSIEEVVADIKDLDEQYVTELFQEVIA